MSRTTKIIFFIGIALLIYGYLCRLLSIYFFWDSKHFGWILIVTGLMGFLIDLRKSRTAQKKNIFFVKVGLGIIVFAFAVAGGAIMVLKTSDTYQNAIERIKIDGQVKIDIGEVRGFGLIPSGSGIIKIANGAKAGPATFIVTVRGNKGYRDVEVNLEKAKQMAWVVVSVRIIYM